MTTPPMVIAELISNVRQGFITAINIDMGLNEESKYGEEERAKAGEYVNAIAKNLDALIQLLVEINPPKTEAPADSAEGESSEPAKE